ncbi:putative zinc finger protein [Orchesella cincta]|uniref:Putative zinc finger protein n=1 Tax=Orchesella cincta TaxID=48709 RepID=A0A1D2MDP6_ORCCI|nr:putative zinc finger protein [Orchesella cincta]
MFENDPPVSTPPLPLALEEIPPPPPAPPLAVVAEQAEESLPHVPEVEISATIISPPLLTGQVPLLLPPPLPNTLIPIDLLVPNDEEDETSFGGGDEDEEELPEEPEMKYFPVPVKTELQEVDSDQSNDNDFLRSINSTSNSFDQDFGAERGVNNDQDGLEEVTTTKPKQRRRRQQRRAADEDDHEDEEWTTYSKTTKRKRQSRKRVREDSSDTKERGRPKSQLTPEEVEAKKAKARERARIKREQERLRLQLDIEIKEEPTSANEDSCEMPKRRRVRKREMSYIEPDSGDDDIMGDDGGQILQAKDFEYKPQRRKKRERVTQRSRSRSSSQKSSLADMTHAEREAQKAKWREEARLKRQRKREQMTETEREEYLRKQREQKRKRRQEQSEAEKDERRRREREHKKQMRAQMTPEQKRERTQKTILRRLERLAQMSEEEKQIYKVNNYLSYLAHKANLSDDEIERRRRLRAEKTKARYAALTEEEKAAKRERAKQWRRSLTGEKRERFLDGLKRCYRNRIEKLKQDPNRWEEVRQKWKESNLKRKSEGKVYKRRPRDPSKPGRKIKNPDETEEERRERIRLAKRISQRRAKLRRKLTIQKLVDSGMTMDEIHRQIETPGQREKRLIRMRVNKAKNDLRKRLSEHGAPPDEIQNKIEEFVATYQPTTNFRPYKPRPESWKPIDPTELVLLEVEKKAKKLEPEVSNTSSPVTVWKPTPPPVFVKSSPSVPHAVQPTYTDLSNYTTPATTPTPSTVPSASSSPFPSTSQHHQQQQHHHHQQQQQQQYTHNLPQDIQYHYQATVPQYQQVHQQAAQPQQNSCYQQPSFQINLFDTINCFQDNSAYHQDDYSSSTYEPVPTSPPSSIPEASSEFGGSDFTPKKGRGRPRIHPKKPKGTGRHQPRQRKSGSLKRDHVCDVCGNAYSSRYVMEHKLLHHNPHYVDGKCTLCDIPFPTGRDFYYKHWTQVHKEKKEDNLERNYVCDLCGTAFRQKNGYDKHKYYVHGDGNLKENYKKCPHCDKEFKQNITLNSHIRRYHEGALIIKYDCYRCEEKFTAAEGLMEHVKASHPESYFPCEGCGVLKYTEASLRFHYSKCKKRPTEAVREERKKWDKASIERTPLPCEICNKSILLFSLTRHYHDIHGITDQRFTCFKCPKMFKRRDFWVVHMEMVHSVNVEEIKDAIRKYNVSDRSTVQIRNPEGGHRGVPEHKRHLIKKGRKASRKGAIRRRSKKDKESEEDEEEYKAPRKTATKSGRGRGRPRGRPRKVKISSEEEEEEEEEDSESEEDEESRDEVEDENDDDEEHRHSSLSSRGRLLSVEELRLPGGAILPLTTEEIYVKKELPSDCEEEDEEVEEELVEAEQEIMH